MGLAGGNTGLHIQLLVCCSGGTCHHRKTRNCANAACRQRWCSPLPCQKPCFPEEGQQGYSRLCCPCCWDKLQRLSFRYIHCTPLVRQNFHTPGWIVVRPSCSD